MKIIIAGGDGFCGWASSLRLANAGHEILIIDNLVRRKIDLDLNTYSLSPISSISKRIKEANKSIGKISFEKLDISKNYYALFKLVSKFNPDAIVHFAEQRSAPYSMIGEKERRYTVENNLSTTQNLLSCIVEINTNIHFVHLGTMGVYGYDTKYGKIPEGYLDITIDNTQKKDKIVYPPNPGSIYHLTKVLDHQLLQFHKKNWNIPITDLHQGVVWGTQSLETRNNNILTNRFDYDGIYGTVLNRFIVQALNNHPITVYGTGGQTRAFIHIDDTAECIKIAIENLPTSENVRVLNQVSETHSVMGLAKIVSKNFGAEIITYENPRIEKKENKLEVHNEGLKSLGFRPKLLSDELINDSSFLKIKNSSKFDKTKVLNSPKWK
jgi:UDP-sulfoquinovose synthase